MRLKLKWSKRYPAHEQSDKDAEDEWIDHELMDVDKYVEEQVNLTLNNRDKASVLEPISQEKSKNDPALKKIFSYKTVLHC